MGRLAELFSMKSKEVEKPLDGQPNVEQKLAKLKDKLHKNDAQKAFEIEEIADQKKKVAAEQMTYRDRY